MPTKGRSPYCRCSDCDPKPWKLGKATTGRAGVVPEKPVKDGFWEKVKETSAERDEELRRGTKS